MTIITSQVWPVNENNEIVLEIGSGSGNITGFSNQDQVPSDTTNNKVPVVITSPTPFSITAGASRTQYLSEGYVLNVNGNSATGTVQQIGLNGVIVKTWNINGSVAQTIGPYSGTQQFLVSCSSGSIDVSVGDAVLSSAILVSNSVGRVTGIATSTGYQKPFIRTTKGLSSGAYSGLKSTLGTGATANSNWHLTRVASRPYNAIEVAYASIDGTNGTIDKVAVAASSSLASAASKYTPDQAWVVSAGGVAVPTAGGTNLVPNLASTGPIACRSVPRADGGKYPIAHIRTFCTASPPAYTNCAPAAAWAAFDPERPLYTFRKGGSDMTSVNQSNFDGANGDAMNIVVAGVKFYYDTVGVSGIGIGDSIMGGDNVNDGSPIRASYSERAVRKLQDQGMPIDFINSALSGDVWANYAARGKVMIDFYKPTFAMIPCFSPNDLYTTQAQIDTQWRNCMNLVEYCVAANVVPIIVTPFPQNNTTATTDGYRRQNRDRALASGFYCLDVEDIASDGATPARWKPSMCDDAPTPGTHPNGACNNLVAERLSLLLKAIFF